MRLPTRGREYMYVPIGPAPDPAAVVEVTVDDWVTWHTAERTEAGVYRVLVAGPDVDVDASPHPAGTVVLPIGRTVVRWRWADTPEVLVRTPGVIDVTPDVTATGTTLPGATSAPTVASVAGLTGNVDAAALAAALSPYLTP